MKHRPVALTELPFVSGDSAPFELYVKMPSSGEMAVFVQRGEKVSAQRWENIKSLASGQNLFVSFDALPPATKSEPAPTLVASPVTPVAAEAAFDRDALKPAAEAALRAGFQKLLQPAAAAAAKKTMSELIINMSNEIYATLVPEVGSFRDSLLSHLKNLQQMNDASAMSALAVLVAVANDFKSKTAFQNLCLTALLMDASLAELSASELETYYRARADLPEHVREKIRNHPLKSQQMVTYLPAVNDTISQLILMHHELHNGQGYHRGIRTVNAPALARVLALAVDLYEYVRGAELNGHVLTLDGAISILKEPGVDPHLRRHAAKLVDNVAAYLKA